MVVRKFKVQKANRPFLLSGIGYGPKGKNQLRQSAEIARGRGYYVRIVQMGKDSAFNGVPRWGAFVLPKKPKAGLRIGDQYMMNPLSFIKPSKGSFIMPQRKIPNPDALQTMTYLNPTGEKGVSVIDKKAFEYDGSIIPITAEELEADRKENPAQIWTDFILRETDAKYHIEEPEEGMDMQGVGLNFGGNTRVPPIRIYSKDMKVDCTGMNCPYPVLMAKNALKEMQPGETLTLTATDWEAEYDVPLLAERYGHELESVEKNRATGEIIFTIKKGESRTYNQSYDERTMPKPTVQCAGCGSKSKSRCRCEGGKTMSPMVDYSEERRLLKKQRKFNKRRYNSRYLDWNMKIDEAISELESSGGRFSTISELQRMKDTIRSAQQMGIELDSSEIDDVIIEGLSLEAKKYVDWRSLILDEEIDIESLFESPQRVDASDFTAMPPFTTDEIPSDFMALPMIEVETDDKFDFETEFNKILEGL